MLPFSEPSSRASLLALAQPTHRWKVLSALLPLLYTGTALAAPSPFYTYEIAARSGFDGVLDIYSSGSINDTGVIAFGGRRVGSRPVLGDDDTWRVVPGGTPVRDLIGFESRFIVGEVEINDEGDILHRSEGSSSFPDPSAPGGINVTRGGSVIVPVPEDAFRTHAAFSWLNVPIGPYTGTDFSFLERIGPYPRINNLGRVVFSYADGDETRADKLTTDEVGWALNLGFDIYDIFDYDRHRVATNQPIEIYEAIQPMIADDGRVVVRKGLTDAAPIVVTNEDGTERTISTNTTENARNPVITPSGRAIAFVGTEPGEEPALFLSYDTGLLPGGSWITPIKVAGPGAVGLGFAPATGAPTPGRHFPTEFERERPMGMIHNDIGEPGLAGDSIVVAFIATPSGASRANPATGDGSPLLYSDQRGLWTVRIDFRRPFDDPTQIVAVRCP